MKDYQAAEKAAIAEDMSELNDAKTELESIISHASRGIELLNSRISELEAEASAEGEAEKIRQAEEALKEATALKESYTEALERAEAYLAKCIATIEQARILGSLCDADPVCARLMQEGRKVYAKQH